MTDAHDDAAARAEETPTVSAEAQVEELRRELDDKQDRLLRALAEADNIRRRAQRDRDDFVKYANETLLRELIPVLDSLDRALESALDERRLVGAVLLVAKRGETVYRRAAGLADREANRRGLDGQQAEP